MILQEMIAIAGLDCLRMILDACIDILEYQHPSLFLPHISSVGRNVLLYQCIISAKASPSQECLVT
jgi:hypothetical protein